MDNTKIREAYKEIDTFADVNESLSVCMDKLTNLGLEAIPVKDENGEFVGLISMRHLRRSHLNPAEVKIRKLIKRVPQIQIDDTLEEASRVMLENNIMHLPVYSGEQFKGIVTHNDILKHAFTGTVGEKTASSIMSKNPEFIHPNDTAAQVLNLFRQHGYSHLPVMDGNKVVGMISIRDIIDLVYRERKRSTVGERVGERISISDIEVKSVMNRPVVQVDVSDTLTECLDKMFRKNISSLVVTDNYGLAGILTKLDFLELIAKEAVEKRRITVQFSIKPSVEVGDKDQEIMIRNFMSFKRKYAKTLGKGTLFVYMKTQGSVDGKHMIVQCRLNLRTALGQYHSSSEAYGPLDAFSIALDRLSRRILQDKENKDGPRTSQRYIEGYLDSEF
ncbi:MAG: CBS domain-containing protein [Candidatus Thorarchaeota archaeon]|nr:CBS domain-containing protein [Candidatus Thorarchaeota archaeon]